MAIRVECPSCRSSFGVRDDFAGRRGKCPKCRAEIQVPGSPKKATASTSTLPNGSALLSARTAEAPEAGPETYDLADKAARGIVRAAATNAAPVAGVLEAVGETRRTRTPAEILAGFRGEIEPFRPTPLYRLWILIIAGFMLLLPLVYVGVVGLVVWAVIYHAVNDATVFQSARGGGAMKGAFLVYFGPIVAGVVVIAFMLKPLFAKSAKGQGQRVLDPDKEPLLYAFVDGVCSSVGAPRPSRIEVDCRINASAGLAGGAFAVFGNELVLRIGLPIVAGLSLKQFAGVLAHEFGHFSQAAGMRLQILIMSINMWFARVVYDRDAWDLALAEWSTNGNIYSMVIAGIARLAVWLTRRVLWVLMYTGHFASGFLSRQMEYDADRYESRMVGGQTFARTTWRMRELILAEKGANADLQGSWQQRRLPDNLPKLVLANVPQIPKEVVAAYRKAMGQAKTGLFDTHPADKDRIARARAEASEGLFNLDGPATDVFRNFDSLSKLVTFEYYRAMLGPQITKDQLYPVSELVQTQAVAQEGYQAFDRYFLHAYVMTQTLPLSEVLPPAAPKDLKAAKQALADARGDLEATRDDHLEVSKRWQKCQDQAVTAELALVLLKAGNRIKAADHGLKQASQEAAQAALMKAERAMTEIAQALEPFNAAAARRLTLALGLLESDDVAARVPGGPALRDEVRALYPCVAHLASRVLNDSIPLIRARVVLSPLIDTFNQGNNQKNQPLINAILRASSQLCDRLGEFKWKINDMIDYPFEHAQEGIGLARFALPLVPAKDDISALMETTDDVYQKLGATLARSLGRLCFAAEQVEQALGFSPIESEPQASDPAAVQDVA
jgi:Zn-dependent protease with chaperone function